MEKNKSFDRIKQPYTPQILEQVVPGRAAVPVAADYIVFIHHPAFQLMFSS